MSDTLGTIKMWKNTNCPKFGFPLLGYEKCINGRELKLISIQLPFIQKAETKFGHYTPASLKQRSPTHSGHGWDLGQLDF